MGRRTSLRWRLPWCETTDPDPGHPDHPARPGDLGQGSCYPWACLEGVPVWILTMGLASQKGNREAGGSSLCCHLPHPQLLITHLEGVAGCELTSPEWIAKGSGRCPGPCQLALSPLGALAEPLFSYPLGSRCVGAQSIACSRTWEKKIPEVRWVGCRWGRDAVTTLSQIL